jgi:hypothetical protein
MAKKESSERDSTGPKVNSFVAEHLPAILTPPSLKPLTPPAPPRSPTLFELAAGPAVPTASSSDRPGIYEALIDDPQVLFQAVLDSPSSYEDGVSELLQELMHRRTPVRDLGQEQQDLLNRAAIEFATGKSPAPPTPTPSPRKAAQPLREVELVHSDQGPHIPEVGLPDAPTTFWWRRR